MSFSTIALHNESCSDKVFGLDTPLGLSSAYSQTPFDRRVVGRENFNWTGTKFVAEWPTVREFDVPAYYDEFTEIAVEP